MADALDRILALAQSALDEFGSPQAPLSASLNKAIRIAMLRNDYENRLWLQLETISVENSDAITRLHAEIQPHFSRSDYVALAGQYASAFASERSMRELDDALKLEDKGNICAMSVAEIEQRVQTIQGLISSAVTPEGLHPVDLYFVDQENFKLRVAYGGLTQEYQGILAKIEQRVHSFLAATEHALVFGQVNSDIFEQNRRYVDEKLKVIAPDVLEKFAHVYRRMGEGDAEARSEAALSCRRILKSLADHVYPAKEGLVTGSDGKERELNDEKYINRLRQFVSERTEGKRAGRLLMDQISDLGDRVEDLVKLSSKGVHAEISEFELNQCVIQTWISVGDTLRLIDADSGIDADIPDVAGPSP